MNKIENIHEDILKRQLDLERLLKLPKNKSDLILKLFDDLMNSFKNGQFSPSTGQSMDINRLIILYHTLVDDGWLVTRREKNLNRLTSE